ncbi:c-type cytochrome [Legionella clemsonensis]|uniref:Cytochrome c5 n=1 Tax=Legionella clemsonensis TaxID=1867846 RepID=A0A222NZT8_9GAMM|nr:c-type cytochrome [Legionella clemsonensis]ASQ45055.1 Cytochrome c5 [Legionella clemsonensis]
MRLRVLILGFVISLSVSATEDFDRQQIEQRIQPIGKVRLQEQKTAAPAATMQPAETETTAAKQEEPGQAIYEKYCSVCHRDGVAGAPKFRVAADWKERLATKKFEGLTASAIKGINAMPPKGTCMECSDEEIKDAVQYMLPQS